LVTVAELAGRVDSLGIRKPHRALAALAGTLDPGATGGHMIAATLMLQQALAAVAVAVQMGTAQVIEAAAAAVLGYLVKALPGFAANQ